MLSPNWDTVRLFLHVLAATIWVGGQITLAALVPVLRRVSPTAPRTVARRFNLVAWPAFGVLLLTGIWNVLAVGSGQSDRYQVTLDVKMAVVAVSGVAAYLHARSTRPATLAAFGALTGLSALAALFVGVLLSS